MLFPYWPEFRHRQTEPHLVPWNDPYRPFYPHHAEFWPASVPEHEMFKQKARDVARKRRRTFLRKLLLLDRLGQFFGRSPVKDEAAARDGKLGAPGDHCLPGPANFRHSQAGCACRPAC